METTEKRKVLVTGAPGIGKTTLVCRVAEQLVKPRGFFTREIREKGSRVGFSLTIFGGQELRFAHVNIPGPCRVSKYGIDVETFEKAVCPEIELAANERAVLVIDEIGKMELYSERFRRAVLAAMESPIPILAAILKSSNPFTDAIKSRPDVELIELIRANRDAVATTLLRRFKRFEAARLV